MKIVSAPCAMVARSFWAFIALVNNHVRLAVLGVTAIAFFPGSTFGAITIVVENDSHNEVFADSTVPGVGDTIQTFSPSAGDTSFNMGASAIPGDGTQSSANLQWDFSSSPITSSASTQGSSVANDSTSCLAAVILSITVDEPYAFTLTGSTTASVTGSTYSFTQFTGTPFTVGFATQASTRDGIYYGVDYLFPSGGTFSGVMTPGTYQFYTWAESGANSLDNSVSSSSSGTLVLTPTPEPTALFLVLAGVPLAGLSRLRIGHRLRVSRGEEFATPSQR